MSIKLSWTVSKRKKGGAVTSSDIERYELKMRSAGAPDFTIIPSPDAVEVSYVLDIVDPGTYEFELVCFPKIGVPSDSASGSCVLEDTSAPVIEGFAVTVV